MDDLLSSPPMQSRSRSKKTKIACAPTSFKLKNSNVGYSIDHGALFVDFPLAPFTSGLIQIFIQTYLQKLLKTLLTGFLVSIIGLSLFNAKGAC